MYKQRIVTVASSSVFHCVAELIEYLYSDLATRHQMGKLIKGGFIGAGKFGSMFLSQVPMTPALSVVCSKD